MTPAIYHPACGTTTPLSEAARRGRARGWRLYAAWCARCQRAITAGDVLWLDDVADVPRELEATRNRRSPNG